MTGEITIYFKHIFETVQDFKDFITDYDIADLTDATNISFAEYLYKVLFRRYHNSNIQFDTVEDFEFELANILEDNFDRYKKQLDLINKTYQLTDAELETISTALANQSNNPNTAPDDPTKPLKFISAQAFTIANNNKLQAYLQALNSIPTKLIDTLLISCGRLFKTIIPREFYYFNKRS